MTLPPSPEFTPAELLLWAASRITDAWKHNAQDNGQVEQNDLILDIFSPFVQYPDRNPENVPEIQPIFQITQLFTQIALEMHSPAFLETAMATFPQEAFQDAFFRLQRLQDKTAIKDMTRLIAEWLQQNAQHQISASSLATSALRLTMELTRQMRQILPATAIRKAESLLNPPENAAAALHRWETLYDAILLTHDTALKAWKLQNLPPTGEPDDLFRQLNTELEMPTCFDRILILYPKAEQNPLFRDIFAHFFNISLEQPNYDFIEAFAALPCCLQTALFEKLPENVRQNIQKHYVERAILRDDTPFSDWLNIQEQIETLILHYALAEFTEILKYHGHGCTPIQECAIELLKSLAASACGQTQRAAQLLSLNHLMTPNHALPLPLETLYFAQRAKLWNHQNDVIIDEMLAAFHAGITSPPLALAIAKAYAQQDDFLNAQNWLEIAEQNDDKKHDFSDYFQEIRHIIATHSLNAANRMTGESRFPLLDLAAEYGDEEIRAQACFELLEQPERCAEILGSQSEKTLESFAMHCLQADAIPEDTLFETALQLSGIFTDKLAPVTLMGFAMQDKDPIRAADTLTQGLYLRDTTAAPELRDQHLALLLDIYLRNRDPGAAANALAIAFQNWGTTEENLRLLAAFLKTGGQYAFQVFQQVFIPQFSPEECQNILENLKSPKSTQKEDNTIEENPLKQELYATFPHLQQITFALLPYPVQLLHLSALLLKDTTPQPAPEQEKIPANVREVPDIENPWQHSAMPKASDAFH